MVIFLILLKLCGQIVFFSSIKLQCFFCNAWALLCYFILPNAVVHLSPQEGKSVECQVMLSINENVFLKFLFEASSQPLYISLNKFILK
jgi:hypothetical protein